MSLSTDDNAKSGRAVAGMIVAVPAHTKSPTIIGMNIAHRLSVIALRKYDERPGDRAPAVTMLLRNALRLAVAHLGAQRAASIVCETLQEPKS